MKEISFSIESNEEIWDLIDKNLEYIFINKFQPNAVIEWWETSLKVKTGKTFKNVKVREMELDIQTNLDVLKEIIDLNTSHLTFYQFSKPISDTLVFERLPEHSRDKILQKNGLKHCFSINYEFLTVGSFDEKFLEEIEHRNLSR